MQRAMIFIDFENFDIAKFNYYGRNHTANPKLNFNLLPQRIVEMLPQSHTLIKTFLFAPKPDEFLMQDFKKAKRYDWLDGMKNQRYFTVIEGRHCSKPAPGHTYSTMDIANPNSYIVEEKGTDVNLATHVITKGFMNAYDTAIIVSGDTDYIPVLDTLNMLGKATVMVGVQGQNMIPFVQHSDNQILLDNRIFRKCLLLSAV